MKQSKMDESEDMEITDEKLTAVYSPAADVSDRGGRESAPGWGGGVGGERGRRPELKW